MQRVLLTSILALGRAQANGLDLVNFQDYNLGGEDLDKMVSFRVLTKVSPRQTYTIQITAFKDMVTREESYHEVDIRLFPQLDELLPYCGSLEERGGEKGIVWYPITRQNHLQMIMIRKRVEVKDIPEMLDLMIQTADQAIKKLVLA